MLYEVITHTLYEVIRRTGVQDRAGQVCRFFESTLGTGRWRPLTRDWSRQAGTGTATARLQLNLGVRPTARSLGDGMGYDLHVTRAETWPDSDMAPITLEEWEACVRTDASLTPDQEAGRNNFV